MVVVEIGGRKNVSLIFITTMVKIEFRQILVLKFVSELSELLLVCWRGYRGNRSVTVL